MVSSAGIGLFIAFVVVLLIFPVAKTCNPEDATDCTFTSMAPEPIRWIVQPSYLAVSLLLIAAGVFMIRFARWREPKTTGGR
jgi:hypothetical protein